jgi:hypothetical protein
MDPAYFKLAHIIGIFLLFLGFGSLATRPYAGPRGGRAAPVLHGIGLLVILLAGFGYAGLAKLGTPPWVWIKVGIWLALGALLILGRRNILPVWAVWAIALILATLASGIGLQGLYWLRTVGL